MRALQRILAAIDFSESSQNALEHAQAWAREHGAELHLLHVQTLFEADRRATEGMFDVDAVCKQLDAQSRSQLEELAVEPRLQVKRAVWRGIAAAPRILEYAREQDVDLIVVGTHGRTGLGHVLLGSVAEQTVRQAPMSVLVVPKGAPPSNETQRVFVPVDFSDASRAAALFGAELSLRHRGRVCFAHVVDGSTHPAFYLFGKDSVFEVFPTLLERSNAWLDQLVQAAGDVDAETVVAEGRVAPELTRLAREHQSDLIAISSEGWGRMGLGLGSVTARILRHAPCAVFVLKEESAAG